jgi:hypothetical protein
VPPSLCFAIKRDMGLLPTTRRGILDMDAAGVTHGVQGVQPDAPRRLKAASPGPVRTARRPGLATASAGRDQADRADPTDAA